MKIWAGYDIETTGLSQPDGHRIIEVGIAIYAESEPGYAELKGEYVQRINPQRPIDPKAQDVHGISFADVEKCPLWHDGPAAKVQSLLSRVHGIVAHNGESFDMPFTNGELTRVGLPEIKTPLVDTMLESRWATPMGKYPSLKELCFATEVDYDPEQAHGALYDVHVMMQAFFAARKRAFSYLMSRPVSQPDAGQ